MIKEINIYLSGKMNGLTLKESNKWRVDVKNVLHNKSCFTKTNVDVFNPIDYYNYENKRHKSEYEIMQFELNKVRKSDIVIVNLEGLNTSIGSCIELYEAYKHDIPILAFGNQHLYDILHPRIQCFITRHDETYIDTVNYIRDFYMT